MQGRDDDTPESGLPGPPHGAQPVAPVFVPRPDPGPGPVTAGDVGRPDDDRATQATAARSAAQDSDGTDRRNARPTLPADRTPSAPASARVGAPVGADARYRTDRDRARSVSRLANPWYRRLARGLVGMAFIAAAALGVYLGVQVVRDVLDRDQLPEDDAEVPTMRTTTIEIRSSTPAPVLDGTLTIDTVTGSFEFVGRGTGSQAGVQVVSPDGETTYVRRDAGAWQVAPPGDQLAADVVVAVDYLSDDVSADAILTRPLRSNYVELVEYAEIGEGDAEVRRYEMRLDTAAFQENSPLDFREFAERAIPGVATLRGVMVTITIDADGVLVQVDDANTNWAWQRLSYSDEAFVPINPSIVTATDASDSSGG